jgi:hypothetical protein
MNAGDAVADPDSPLALRRFALEIGQLVRLLVRALVGPRELVLGLTLRRLTRRAATLAIAGGPPRMRRVLELCAIDGVELHHSVSADRPAALATPREAPLLNLSTSNE